MTRRHYGLAIRPAEPAPPSPLAMAGIIVASALGWVVMTAAFYWALPYAVWVVVTLCVAGGLL